MRFGKKKVKPFYYNFLKSLLKKGLILVPAGIIQRKIILPIPYYALSQTVDF